MLLIMNDDLRLNNSWIWRSRGFSGIKYFGTLGCLFLLFLVLLQWLICHKQSCTQASNNESWQVTFNLLGQCYTGTAKSSDSLSVLSRRNSLWHCIKPAHMGKSRNRLMPPVFQDRDFWGHPAQLFQGTDQGAQLLETQFFETRHLSIWGHRTPHFTWAVEEEVEGGVKKKRTNYQDLVKDYCRNGWRTMCMPVEVGWRGFPSARPTEPWASQEQAGEKPSTSMGETPNDSRIQHRCVQECASEDACMHEFDILAR